MFSLSSHVSKEDFLGIGELRIHLPVEGFNALVSQMPLAEVLTRLQRLYGDI